MAPPRRKSCAACIKSKRRCDLGYPSCQRCVDKNVTCDYGEAGAPPYRTAIYQRQFGGSSSAWPATLSSGSIEATHPMLVPVSESLTLPPDIMDTSEASLGTSGPAFLQSGMPAGIAGPSAPIKEPEENDELSQRGKPNSIVFASNHRGDVGYHVIVVGEIWTDRVAFIATRLTTLPLRFAKHVQCPFIHKATFEDSSVPIPNQLLEALSASALYASRNEENQSFVFSDIRTKANGLACKATLPFESPVELLTTTQALLIYQLIMLFDGDIRMRHEAENNEKILQHLCDELWRRADRAHPVHVNRPEIQSVSTSTKEQLPVGAQMRAPMNAEELPHWFSGSNSEQKDIALSCAWREWSFHESMRRTCLTAYLVQAVYDFLKYGKAFSPVRAQHCTITASKAMWHAPSEFHWREAAATQKQWIMLVDEWENDMLGSTGAEFDELSVMLTAARKGMDYTMEWLGKELLDEYGLQWSPNDISND